MNALDNEATVSLNFYFESLTFSTVSLPYQQLP